MERSTSQQLIQAFEEIHERGYQQKHLSAEKKSNFLRKKKEQREILNGKLNSNTPLPSFSNKLI